MKARILTFKLTSGKVVDIPAEDSIDYRRIQLENIRHMDDVVRQRRLWEYGQGDD